MQLDLYDLINAEDEQTQRVMEEERLMQKLTEVRMVLGWEDYEKIKAEQSLNVDINSLPWTLSHSNLLTSDNEQDFEHCDVKVIIPPDAISAFQYHQKIPCKRGHEYSINSLRDACQKLWLSYNTAIWKYTPHNVNWMEASDLLSKHRDTGEPIWIRVGRLGKESIHNFEPDCIVKLSGI